MTATTAFRIGGPVFRVNASSITYTATTINSYTSDTNGIAAAGIMWPEATIAITHVGYRQDTTTLTPASNSYKISLQSLSASGAPSGTVLGGGSPASATFQPSSANDGKFVWVQLANAYTWTIGDAPLAVVLHQASADAVNYISVTSRIGGLDGNRTSFPYSSTRSGTSWTAISAGVSCFAIKNGATPTLVHGYPIEAITEVTINSTSQAGLQFQIPSSIFTTYKARRLCGAFLGGSSSKSIGIKIITAAGTEQASYATTVDTDHQSLNTFSAVDLPFSGSSDLAGGTDYVAALVPGDGSTNAKILCIDVRNPEDMLAFPGDTAFLYASRASGSGAFSVTNTRRPIMALDLSDVVTGGGGRIFGAGMHGGFNA